MKMKTTFLILGCMFVFFTNYCFTQNNSKVCLYSDNPDEGSVSLIISFDGNSFKAFYSEYPGDGVSDYYLTGTFENNKAICKVLACRNYGTSGDTGEDYNTLSTTDCGTKFLYSKSGKSIINVDDPDPLKSNLGWHMKLLNEQPKVPLNDMRNFRETPSKTGKIISKIDLSKDRLNILELGPFEIIGIKAGFWYKVSSNGVEGWIFGG